MSQRRLEALTKKREQINAQIQAIKAKESAEKRKLDTRQKILIGGVMKKLVKSGEIKKGWLVQLLDENLESERDRKLFNLPTKVKQETTN